MMVDNSEVPRPSGVDAERVVSAKVVLVTADGGGLVFRYNGEVTDITGETAVQRDEVATSRLILPGDLGTKVVESEFTLTLTARRRRAPDGTPLGDDGTKLVRVERYPRLIDSEPAVRRLAAFLAERFPELVAAQPPGANPIDLTIALLEHLGHDQAQPMPPPPHLAAAGR